MRAQRPRLLLLVVIVLCVTVTVTVMTVVDQRAPVLLSVDRDDEFCVSLLVSQRFGKFCFGGSKPQRLPWGIASRHVSG